MVSEAQRQQSLRVALVEIAGGEQYGFPAGAMVHEAASLGSAALHPADL